jgi:predicted nucleic-acid-binding protein
MRKTTRSYSAKRVATPPRKFTEGYFPLGPLDRASLKNSRRPFFGAREKSMRAVDTNILVRLITRDDDEQVALADAFVRKGAWVSHFVLAEMTWVLAAAYELDHGQIATAIDMLLSHAELSLQEADVVAAALEHYRKRPTLGFSDCLVLESARRAGHLPLGTFDRALGKLDGAERLR